MSAKGNEAKSAPADRVLEITRVFAAPRHLVFEAWTDPAHLKHWSAPKGFTIPVCEGDLRVGGRWRCCMVSPEGVEHWLGGVYREIERDRKIVQTHVWDSEGGHETLLTVTFEDVEGGTKMTMHQAEFQTRASRDDHREGWNECFDKLETLLTDAHAGSSR